MIYTRPAGGLSPAGHSFSRVTPSSQFMLVL